MTLTIFFLVGAMISRTKEVIMQTAGYRMQNIIKEILSGPAGLYSLSWVRPLSTSMVGAHHPKVQAFDWWTRSIYAATTQTRKFRKLDTVILVCANFKPLNISKSFSEQLDYHW